MSDTINLSSNSNYPDESSFNGRYTDFKLLGEGGMGSVFKAQDTVLNKPVAIKFLKFEHGQNPKHIARLQKEAKALAKLSHPGIISIYDFGLSKEDEPYLVMEFLTGNTLENYLNSNHEMNWEESYSLFVQTIEALKYAHGKGIIHRDLKPSNIFILNNSSPDVTVKLIDFGISAITESEQGQTTSGAMLGSAGYMSPEQTQTSGVDNRSDIYSLGCVMFRTLTDQIPIEGSTANETILLKRTEIAPKLKSKRKDLEFSDQVESLIATCLEVNPLDRFSDMEEVLRIMEQTREQEGKIAPPDSMESGNESSKNKSMIMIAIAILIVGALILLVMQSSSKQKEENKEVTTKSNEIENLSKTFAKANMDEAIFDDRVASKLLTDVRGITWLEISGPVNADYIKSLKREDYIHIHHLSFKITDGILEALVEKQPIGLNLSKTGITDSQFSILTNIPNLAYLNLSGCTALTGKSVDKLKSFKKLNTLKLSAKNLTEKDFKTISNHPSINSLYFIGQSEFQKNAVASLKRKRSYKRLWISGADLKTNEFETLTKLINTESLGLSNMAIKDEQLEILANAKIKALALTKCRVGKGKIGILASNNVLNSLYLIETENVTAHDIKDLKSLLGTRCKVKALLVKPTYLEKQKNSHH